MPSRKISTSPTTRRWARQPEPRSNVMGLYSAGIAERASALCGIYTPVGRGSCIMAGEPTNMRSAEDRHARIRDRAYDLWERAGRPEDTGEKFWHQASAEIDAEEARFSQAQTGDSTVAEPSSRPTASAGNTAPRTGSGEDAGLGGAPAASPSHAPASADRGSGRGLDEGAAAPADRSRRRSSPETTGTAAVPPDAGSGGATGLASTSGGSAGTGATSTDKVAGTGRPPEHPAARQAARGSGRGRRS
jgi:hypothetical protein